MLDRRPDEAQFFDGLAQTRRDGAVDVGIVSVRMEMAVMGFAVVAVVDWTQRVEALLPASGRMRMRVALISVDQPGVDVIPRRWIVGGE